MDAHVRREITEGLRSRSLDIVTAQEDGNAAIPDDQLNHTRFTIRSFSCRFEFRN
jgi:hypothetical protein